MRLIKLARAQKRRRLCPKHSLSPISIHRVTLRLLLGLLPFPPLGKTFCMNIPLHKLASYQVHKLPIDEQLHSYYPTKTIPLVSIISTVYIISTELKIF